MGPGTCFLGGGGKLEKAGGEGWRGGDHLPVGRSGGLSKKLYQEITCLYCFCFDWEFRKRAKIIFEQNGGGWGGTS